MFSAASRLRRLSLWTLLLVLPMLSALLW
jgi:hypothetical protein